MREITRRRFILLSMQGAAAVALPPLFTWPAAKRSGTPRLAIAGLGYRGNCLLQSCLQQSVPIKALCDTDAYALNAATRQISGIQAYTSFNDLLHDPGVDAIAVTAPPGPDFAERALGTGKHVFLMSYDRITSSEAASLAQLCRENKSLTIGHAPGDLSWDLPELNRLLMHCASSPESRSRLTLITSASGEAGSGLNGSDLLNLALHLAGNRMPERVIAVSTRSKQSWSATFFLDGSSSVEIHVQASPVLRSDTMSLEIEKMQPGGGTKMSIASFLSNDSAGDPANDVPGFGEFLDSIEKKKSSIQPVTQRSLVYLGWRGLLNDALLRVS